MPRNQDYTRTMQELFASFPVDAAPFKEAFRAQTVLGEQLARVALEAAERSTEVSAQWSRDSIARMGEVVSAKNQPTDYAKAMSDFAGSAAETAAKHMAAYAEIARKVQADTVALMLSAGRDFADNAQNTTRDMASKVSRQAEALAGVARAAQKDDVKA